jgi:hypothetical protein
MTTIQTGAKGTEVQQMHDAHKNIHCNNRDHLSDLVVSVLVSCAYVPGSIPTIATNIKNKLITSVRIIITNHAKTGSTPNYCTSYKSAMFGLSEQ